MDRDMAKFVEIALSRPYVKIVEQPHDRDAPAAWWRGWMARVALPEGLRYDDDDEVLEYLRRDHAETIDAIIARLWTHDRERVLELELELADAFAADRRAGVLPGEVEEVRE